MEIIFRFCRLAGVSLFGGLVLSGCAGNGQPLVTSPLAAVPFATYSESFPSGDTVVIGNVFASNPKWGPGDTLTVRGSYRLSSQPSARLALYVTTRNGSRTPSRPTQAMSVRQGSGDFELTCEMPAGGGEPHVSFYPSGGGSVFGGVYFRPASR